MKINLKQQQLIDELLAKVKERYPEIVVRNMEPTVDSPDDIWIHVLADMDEERQMELSSYAAELETDILTDYGYAFTIMPHNPNTIYA
ncbi:MAG: hypothetical protein NT007_14165 [Candidatus Kapabacteria bacterium]|nr:hypothetical protein [Candidatus Kapabacteria bacterium]